MEISDERLISPQAAAEDFDNEFTLRPRTLDEYIGQEKIKGNLRVYLEAARRRGEPLDHLLLYGPPGLGKTTLACICLLYTSDSGAAAAAGSESTGCRHSAFGPHSPSRLCLIV